MAHNQDPKISEFLKRRTFMKASGIFALGTLVMPDVLLSMDEDLNYDAEMQMFAESNIIRSLQFVNINTHEFLDVTYYENGTYSSDALNQINSIMADRRSGETTTMDLELIEMLHQIQTISGTKEPIEIICGYRSPNTNARLRHAKRGVAKRSYHMLGQAADIALPDIPLSQLNKIAASLQAGGVGFYPRSGFIHVDVGPVRTWRG